MRVSKGSSVALLTLTLLAVVPALLSAQDFVYTNNDPLGPNSVSAFSVGPNGALTQVLGSPFLTGGTGVGGGLDAANRITTAVAGNFLYASNSGSNDISGFSINTTTGVLTPIPGSPFATGGVSGGFAISLAVTPDGQLLYAGNILSDNISAFGIGSNGVLTPIVGSPFAAGGFPVGMKVSPNGKFLAVGLTPFVAMFSIASNGALAPVPGSPFFAGGGGGVGSVDINCASNLLFAPISVVGQARVSVLSIASNGALTPILGSPFTFGGSVSATGALSPDEQHLFVSNLFSTTITSLNVAPGGSLTEVNGSPFPGVFAAGMATNQAGTFLYAAGPNAVSGFSIASNGTLSQVPGSPFSTGVFGTLLSLTVFPPKSCAAPSGLHATVGNQMVFLHWNPSPQPVDGYEVFQDDGTNVATIDAGVGNNLLVLFLVNGQLYKYTLKAIKNGVLGPPSNFVLARPGEFAVSQPPPKPANRILFLHGIASDATTWNTTGIFLRDTVGWKPGGTISYLDTDDPRTTFPQVSADFNADADFFAVNFGSDCGPLDLFGGCVANYGNAGRPGILHQADEVQGFLRRLQAAGRSQKVTLVGHSMGGMAARSYIADNPTDAVGRVSQFTTYGSPHWGVSKSDIRVFLAGLASRGAGDLQVDCVGLIKSVLDYSQEPSPEFFLDRLRIIRLPDQIRYFVIRGSNDSAQQLSNTPCLSSQGDGLVSIDSADLGTVPQFAPAGQNSVTTGPVPLLTTSRLHQGQQTSDYSAILCVLDLNCFILNGRSPVDLEIVAPDGRSVARQLVEIPGASHMDVANAIGHATTSVLIPFPLGGNYSIKVVPKSGASPSDTYTLEVIRAGVATIVAQDQRVQDIPAQPYVVTVLPPLAIDIKPGSKPAPINLQSPGTIPVAILSSSTFNAPSQVDVTSLKFGRTGAEQSLAFCNSSGEDVNGDGLPDLVCHFNTRDSDFTPGDTQGVLKGKTVEGIPFVGTDLVLIVP